LLALKGLSAYSFSFQYLDKFPLKIEKDDIFFKIADLRAFFLNGELIRQKSSSILNMDILFFSFLLLYLILTQQINKLTLYWVINSLTLHVKY